LKHAQNGSFQTACLAGVSTISCSNDAPLSQKHALACVSSWEYALPHIIAAQSKGGKTRTVFLNQRLRRALAEYAAGLNLSDPNRALFESQKGGHFSANTMCQLFLDIYKAVGLKDASSHSGRRTYITRLANKGVGVRGSVRQGGVISQMA
jgi:integrase